MWNPIRWLNRRRFPYTPMISVEISKDRLLNNLDQFKILAPHRQIAPVLKSNAYGHGLFEIAEILKNQKDIPFFIIDSYFEAVALRSKGIKNQLLIMGYTSAEDILHSKLKNVMFTIGSIDTLKSISSSKKSISIQLKIDTGMHRQGILPEEIFKACDIIEKNPHIIPTGIFSHMNDAENSDTSYTENQIRVWNGIATKLTARFPSIRYVHLGATYSHRFGNSINANLSRLGLGLYGLVYGNIFDPKLNILPVLSIKTVLTNTKILKKSEAVGYDNSFTAQKDMTVATIPVGYFEGVDRRLSNIGSVKIDDTDCPIIGKVSMNMTTIDVSNVKNLDQNSSVTVISNNPSDENTIYSWSKKCGTIPYEIAVHIGGHLKRIVT